MRLGHGSSRAALIHQHGNQEREREIADAVDSMIVKAMQRGSRRKVRGELRDKPPPTGGPGTARTPHPGGSPPAPPQLERATGIEPA